MSTQPQRTCPSCGNEFSGAMEFCPVCMLRKGLAGGVVSGESSLEEAVRRTPEQATQRFEHYELVTGEDGKPVELGRGAMGVTYKAFDVDLHCPVTLKVINEKYLGDESARLRFIREARAAAGVRHANVASVFHLGRTGSIYFYAMEFVKGETLENLINRSDRLKVKLALEIATQVATGLAAVHKQRLVHRDIKPSNIMVSLEEGGAVTAKIIDLGLAKPASDATEAAISIPGAFAGTPEFASPEQFGGVGVDIRSDLYSLGVTLWIMVTGQTPFRGPSAEVMFKHQHAPLPRERLEDVPQPVVVLLEKLLEKDPAQRFQTPNEVLKAMPTIADAIDSRRRINRRSLQKTPPTASRVGTRKPPARLAPKKISIARLPVTGSDIFGREEVIGFLDDAWANQQVNVVTIVAWAGVGKSTLVNHWLRRMAAKHYRSAELVFGWSFYRQDTSGDIESAADRRMRFHWFGRGAAFAAPHRPYGRQRLNKLTYAASEDALEDARTAHNRHVLVRADIADGAAMRQVFATHEPDAVMHLAAETHVDRSIDGPAVFVQTNVVGTFTLLEAARRYLTTLGAARRAAFRFHHVSTDEVFGALGPDDAPFDEATPYDPRSPYAGQQGCLRSSGARLVPYLRVADDRQQHREQLRPLAVSGEADPAGHAQCAGGQTTAGLRRRLQPARLDLCRGPCGRLAARAGARPAGRHLRDRRPPAAQQPRRGARHLRGHLDLRVPDPLGPRERLIHFVVDRPGHDFRYDPPRGPRRHWAGRRRTTSRPGWRAPSTRSGASRLVAEVARRTLRRTATGDRGMKGILLAGGPARGSPDDPGGVQAAAAGLRQADDLLPAVDADARRHPRHPGDLDPAGHCRSSRRCSATARSSACRLRYAVSRAGRHRPGIPDRRATSSAATACALILGDNLFYGHDLAHPACARATARLHGATRLRLPGARSRTLRRGRVRCATGAALDIEEKPAHPSPTGRSPGCISTTRRGRHLARTLQPSPAANWRSPTSTASISKRGRCASSAWARLRLARHRHARFAAARLRRSCRRSSRAPAEDRLPRGGGVPHGLYQTTACCGPRRASSARPNLGGFCWSWQRGRSHDRRDDRHRREAAHAATLPRRTWVLFRDLEQSRFVEAGVPGPFVQDNHAMSVNRGVIRGLHLQIAPSAQGKLIRVVRGAIWDVAVDIRPGSPTYGRHVGAVLSAENWQQFWISRRAPAWLLHARARHGGDLQGDGALGPRGGTRGDLERPGAWPSLADRSGGGDPVRQGPCIAAPRRVFRMACGLNQCPQS